MTPAQVTDMLQPYTTVGPSPTGSNASYFGPETTNQQTNNGGNERERERERER